jgi:hypothetical protein
MKKIKKGKGRDVLKAEKRKEGNAELGLGYDVFSSHMHIS